MNCKEVQAQILSYIHGEVTPSERRLIAAHLSGCPRCTAEVENMESVESQLRRHIQQRALRVAAPVSGWQALQVRLDQEIAPEPGRADDVLRRLFSRLALSGWRLAAAVFLLLLAVFALTPSVRAQVQAQIRQVIGDWFHFSSPDGQSQAEIGGFSAFTPYHATYLPEGFRLSGMGGSSAPDIETITLSYNSQQSFIELAQSAGSELPPLPQGKSLPLNGSPAVFVAGFASSAAELQAKRPWIAVVVEYDYSHTNLLAWELGELRVEMFSNLPEEEMVRIAGSLAPMQSGPLPPTPDAGGSGWGAAEYLALLLFGWAGIGLGLGLVALGLLKSSSILAIAGWLLGLPFSFYLFATPRGWLLGLLIPACLAVSAWTAGSRARLRLGLLSLLLAAGIAGFVFLFTR